MDALLKIAELCIFFCVACFPITTAIMIFSLKRYGLDPVGSHVKSNWSINIDMKFFSNLRKGYAIAEGNKFILHLNLISFYGGLFGIVFFPIIAALFE
jgi:hypothetical protein